MTTRSKIAAAALLAGAALWAAPRARGDAFGFKGKSEVAKLELLNQLADMKSRGSRLAVELEGSEVKAFYVAVGGAFLGKDE